MWIERRLFREVTHLALDLGPVGADVLSLEENISAGRLDQSGEHFHGRAFAGSIGSHVPEDLAGTNGEADTIDRRNPVVALDQITDFKHANACKRGISRRVDSTPVITPGTRPSC